MNLSAPKQSLLSHITTELRAINGVKAVVLGGSHAAGTAESGSDLDIGIYYDEEDPFDILDIRTVAQKLSLNDTPVVTGFYEWGRWVNGGAWINTTTGEVDFIYKNIRQITDCIEKAKEGSWENDYEQQPPYGFSSLIYLAETACCIPLYDPENRIAALKEKVQVYPDKLQQSVIQQSLWATEFTNWQAGNFATKADMYATMGCLTRATKSLVNALFAVNKIYPLGDKRALEILEKAAIKPASLTDRVNRILSCKPDTLPACVDELKKLTAEVILLADGKYKPYYPL